MADQFSLSLLDSDSMVSLIGQFDSRLRQAKTKERSEEIELAMDSFCADLLGALQQWVMIGKRSSFAEGCILYWIEKYWDDLVPLHGQYESFHDFATQETGEDYATYRMKISVFRTFILNEKRDPVVEEYGAATFLSVPLGKLQKAVGTVRKGEMSEDKWQALVDENVGDRHFHHVMKTENTLVAEPPEVPVKNESEVNVAVDMADGTLRVWKGNVGVNIGYLDVRSKDESIREVVDSIIEQAGIRRS